MDVAGHDDGQTKRYITSHRVQAWFLGRSRDRWKRKYQDLKTQAKRLQNRVRDVSKSRAQWREEAEKLQRQLQELEVHNAALLQEVAAEKN